MYTKPELLTEEFDVEDLITVSSAGPVTGPGAEISGPGMSGGSNDPFEDDEEEEEISVENSGMPGGSNDDVFGGLIG